MPGRALVDLDPLLTALDAGVTVLTPNHRLARHVRRAWNERQRALGRRAWRTAAVDAVEPWLLARWTSAAAAGVVAPRRCLEPHAVLYLWRQVIEAERDEAAALALLQARESARLAQRARDTLLRWRLDPCAADLRQALALGDDTARFQRWLERFEARLEAAGAATAADCLTALLHTAPDRQPLLLVAGEELSPLVRACVEAIAAPLERPLAPAPRARRETRLFADERSELAAVARWCARRLGADRGARIGVVLDATPQRRAVFDHCLRRAFDCVDASYHRLPVNYSAGITLDRAPLVRDALAVLALLEREVSGATLRRLLASRFLSLPDRDAPAMVAFRTRLQAVAGESIDVGLLRYLAADAGTVLGERLLQLRDRLPRPRPQAPERWVALFLEVLGAWGWPGSGLDSLEYQQLGLWGEALDAFADCAALGPAPGPGEALGLLTDCCAARIFQPQTAERGVQVLGALEAGGLSFDALWVTGMHSAAWPAPARPNPLLPLSLQRERGMPQATAASEWAFSQRLLQRYAAAVDELVLSAPLAADGLPLLPSPFLDALPATAPADDAVPVAWSGYRGAVPLEAIDDRQGPPLAGDALRGGAGLLQAQSACPFQAFARYRLDAAAAAVPRLGLDAGERGSLLHGALYALWGELGGSEALALRPAAAREAACEAAAAAAVASLPAPRRRVLGEGFLNLERQRLRALLSAWLQVEGAREEAFTVLLREAPVAVELAGLTLRLRLDRVDRLADGSELLLDYKAGRVALAELFGERPTAPQLPLYSIAHERLGTERPLTGVTYASLRPRRAHFLGIGARAAVAGLTTDPRSAGAGREEAGDWPALRAAWRQRLESLAIELRGGAAAVAPRPGACDRCDLAPLCRIGEREAAP